MCGIAGFLKDGPAEPADDGILRRMTRSLEHRGPDQEGMWSGSGAFLGHRRLSIIDLKDGRQPMANEDGRVRVVFNGEIYNHHQLRRELTAKGHVFASRSDTEVLVHLWEEEAEAMLGRLNGMFALALWDDRDRTLLLARDLMGKKPLFWGMFDGLPVFASEMRAMLKHPAVPRRVDPASLYRFLTLDYVPTPLSILEGVRKVEAGGYVLIREGEAREGRHSEIRLPERPLDLNPRDAATRVWETLVRTTGARLESDVPLGVFLSGGLDSTAVVAAMAEHVPPSEISTFTIGFDDPSFDESGPARTVARHLGTDHHERILTGRDALDLVQNSAFIADEPLGDYSIIPTYMLSRFTRDRVTVALSGDGGDELFYGYPTFSAHRAAKLAARLLPRAARERWLPGLMSMIPAGAGNWSLDYKLLRFAKGLKYGDFERHFTWIGGMDPAMARHVMNPELTPSLQGLGPYPDCEARLSHCRGWPDLKALSYLYARLYLQDGVLVKADRASMAVGLEVRSPFLDPDMVALAFALPAGMSLKGRRTKILLRKALKGRVPDRIIQRPKKGFGMPLARWLRTDLKPLVHEVLAPEKLAREGFLRPSAVSRMVEAHMSGRANMRKEIFSLMVFELWLSRYLT
ncbi:MAG: asparagine synthase (glutamine-hydrolyzing) [Deltaproteobacteria bacterium]|nr:asparagine synthase (glutamine-hydrolyzing) [Deltaproteobacteria bacterium]